MDANNIQTNRTNSVDDWAKDTNVLLIGRRGSTCIGLNDSNSDIDYLVVGKNNSDMLEQENIMLDTNLVTQDRFELMLSRMSIETIEALYNLEYVSDTFEEQVAQYKNYVENGNDTYFLFWYQIWLMLKNQIKQFNKGVNNSKFASKIYLYSALLKNDNILDYWVKGKIISQDIKDNYFRIRGGVITDADVRLIDNIAAERNNATLRADYRARYNSALSEFKGFE